MEDQPLPSNRSKVLIPPGAMAILVGLFGGQYLTVLLYVFAGGLFPIGLVFFIPMVGFFANCSNPFLRVPAYVVGGMGFGFIFTACIAGGLSVGTVLTGSSLVFGVVGLWLGIRAGSCRDL